MALVNWGFLHYMDMKKFLKNFFLQNRFSDFEIISQECSLGDPFQKLMAKLWHVYKYGSGEWGFMLYTDMKKFTKNLVLRNCWSDFYTPVEDGTYYGITRGGRAGGRAGGVQFFVRSISPKLL